jgi:aryl-alcohol dehydrogenase-like predicted oxidoreductase
MNIRIVGSEGLEVSPTVRELGIGFVAYCPSGRGFLSGAIRSLDDLAEDDFAAGIRAFRARPIPGTKRRRYLEENVGAADVKLTPEELDRIESAFPKGATAGDRYPDMSTVNR